MEVKADFQKEASSSNATGQEILRDRKQFSKQAKEEFHHLTRQNGRLLSFCNMS